MAPKEDVAKRMVLPKVKMEKDVKLAENFKNTDWQKMEVFWRALVVGETLGGLMQYGNKEQRVYVEVWQDERVPKEDKVVEAASVNSSADDMEDEEDADADEMRDAAASTKKQDAAKGQLFFQKLR